MPLRDQIGPYEVLSQLGAGGMGEVYLARDSRLRRKVALKVLPEAIADADRLRRFQREAEAVAALNHPNIVTIYAIEELEGVRLLSMELVEGKTLAELIPEGGLPARNLIEIAVALADALGAAHRRGIIHRDLKASNIMVSGEGRVKILDFGLAKLRRRPDDRVEAGVKTVTMTEDGAILGTLPYMSPEQLSGESADERSDIFSLGIVLFEAATGRRPFRARSPAVLMSSILRDVPAPVSEARPDLPPDLDRIIARCLEKEPLFRFQTCRELEDRLQQLEAAPSSQVSTASATALARERPDHDRRAPATGSRMEGAGDSAADRSSVAVLPFVDMSGDHDQAYFCEGVAEELINALARVAGLRVASRTSSFLFRDAGLDIREIGARLDVGTVLEGSVRKAGDRLRVSAQLIDASDGCQLWSGRYDREMQDVLAIQDEIASATAEALRGVLTDRDKQVLKSPQSVRFQAYDHYLRGRQFFHRGGRAFTASARQLFLRAIEIDPEYAVAHAGIADCCSFLHMYYEPEDRHLADAESASLKAVELAPGLAEAHAARGLALSLSGRPEESRRAFELAIGLGGQLFEARYLYARARFAEGDLEHAASLFEQARELQPGAFRVTALLAKTYRGLGRHGDARAADRRTVELAEHHLELDPDDTLARALGACALVEIGERERGLAWAARAGKDCDPLLYYVACCYARAGEPDRALSALEGAVDAGWSHWDWLRHDGDLSALRDRPRFAELVSRSASAEAPAATGEPSVAVLPFVDMSPEQDQEYFCEGIAEELINALTRIDGLAVASRTSAWQFKKTQRDIREIGRRLGVSTVLEGSLRKAGDQLRITTQLIKVADGYHLWSRRFDRQLEDVFAVQDEIAEATAEALRGVLTEGEKKALKASRTADPQAYDLYLRGRYFFYQARRQSFTIARGLFRRAIELDPGFGLAWAGIADSCSFSYLWWGKNEDDLREADRASRKAVELEPDSPEAHAARGLALATVQRYDEAEREFESALQLDGGAFEPLYLFGRMRFAQGRFEQAADLFLRASEARSEDFQALALMGNALRGLNRQAEARGAMHRSVERAERALELDPEDVRALYLAAGTLVCLGERERGLEWAARALAIAPEDPFVLWNVACSHSLAGEAESAIDLLEKAFDLDFGHKEWVEHDPDMDPLRDHPRFQDLLCRLK